MVPMNLWYAGLVLGLWLHLRGDQYGRRFGSRLLQQMPVIIAAGVNFGIVPLLFIQLAYYKVFYPATILMAWAWLAIVGLLIPAYYGVYAYALGLRNGVKGEAMARWRVAAGWIAAVFFITIGFLFTNGLSLMDHVERWPELWQNHSVAGAALGTAMNLTDPTLWPRWFLMFGLAMGTTAVWMLVDAVLLAGKTADEGYRQWAVGFAKHLYTLAMLWTAAAGMWYVFYTWSPAVKESMFAWPLLPLTLATGAAMGLPWLMIVTLSWCPEKRVAVGSIAACQFGVLGVNALSRQIVQNINLLPYLKVAEQPTDVQWGPLWMFLIAFVIGLIVIGWMFAQLRNCKPAPASR
jgi:MFS family permease